MRIGRRLTNLPALRAIGFPANRRLLGAQRLSHDPINGARAFHDVTNPVITDEGTRTAALRFGDQRVHALLSALLVFRLQPHGFTNKDLRALVAPLRGQPADTLTAGQMTYDLRRLRVHGLIERIEHTHRYRLTDPGLRQAMFLTRVHDRLIRTGLSQLCDPRPSEPSALATAARIYQRALDQLTGNSGLAA